LKSEIEFEVISLSGLKRSELMIPLSITAFLYFGYITFILSSSALSTNASSSGVLTTSSSAAQDPWRELWMKNAKGNPLKPNL
jgi:hypothetical protein